MKEGDKGKEGEKCEGGREEGRREIETAVRQGEGGREEGRREIETAVRQGEGGREGGRRERMVKEGEKREGGREEGRREIETAVRQGEGGREADKMTWGSRRERKGMRERHGEQNGDTVIQFVNPEKP